MYYGMERGAADPSGMEKTPVLKTTSTPHGGRGSRPLHDLSACPGDAGEIQNNRGDIGIRLNGDRPVAPTAAPVAELNYIQALPGTAVYEFAREKRADRQSLADEEKYLMAISDWTPTMTRNSSTIRTKTIHRAVLAAQDPL